MNEAYIFLCILSSIKIINKKKKEKKFIHISSLFNKNLIAQIFFLKIHLSKIFPKYFKHVQFYKKISFIRNQNKSLNQFFPNEHFKL